MSALTGLALRSLWNRRSTVVLTVFAVAVSVAMLLGVQKFRTAAQDSFASTISGTDLVVGARSGPLNLLLYAVFRIGDPTANVSWKTFRMVSSHRDVAWTIPLSMGDSHRGYRVVGTTDAYFAHYRYAQGRGLTFVDGRAFGAGNEVVLGSEVARRLGYAIGDSIVISHGIGEVSFKSHDANPGVVAGILEATGTPVDRTIHVPLEMIDNMHGLEHADQSAGRSLSAFLVGMKSRESVLMMQRALNEYREEPLQAVIPGVALAQLWSIVGVADRALMLIAACVALAGLLGMMASILTSLNERRREMAILRSVGAQPRHVFGLLLLESALLTVVGVFLGVLLVYAILWVLRPWIAAHFGIHVPIAGLTRTDATLLTAVVAAAVLMSAYPAWRAYRNSLADGLTIRL